jgi:hypothetical protein
MTNLREFPSSKRDQVDRHCRIFKDARLALSGLGNSVSGAWRLHRIQRARHRETGGMQVAPACQTGASWRVVSGAREAARNARSRKGQWRIA